MQLSFWLSLTLCFVALAITGSIAAWIILPEPLNYYRTNYLEFSLPENWRCNQESSDFVCSLSKDSRDSIIIFTAKLRNQQDTLDEYEKHLLKPRTYLTPDNMEVTSNVVKVERIVSKGRVWVDSIHFESEIPNYYTQYLATVTAQLGVAVTFSYHVDASENIKRQFKKSIENLEIHQKELL